MLVVGAMGFIIYKSPASTDELILNKLNELEAKLDTISDKKDSIRVVIATIDDKLVKNENHYETVVNNIMSQPDSIVADFTRQYLREFCASRGYTLCGPSETSSGK